MCKCLLMWPVLSWTVQHNACKIVIQILLKNHVVPYLACLITLNGEIQKSKMSEALCKKGCYQRFENNQLLKSVSNSELFPNTTKSWKKQLNQAVLKLLF